MTTVDHRRTARHAALMTAVLAGVAATGGCGVVSGINSRITHVESRHFDTYSDAPTRGDLAFVLTDVVPRDATDISVTVATDDSPRAYAWTSATAPEQGCPAAPQGVQPAPKDPEGFPDDLDTAGAVVCGALVEVRDGQRTYAWLEAHAGPGTDG